MRRIVLVLAFVVGLGVTAASAQGEAPRLLQSDDGAFWVLVGGQRFPVVPEPIGADALAAIPNGQAATAAAAPAPSQTQGATYNGVTVQILAAEQNWRSQASVYAPPKDGMQHVTIEVLYQNGTGSPASFNVFQFELQATDATRWRPTVSWRKPSFDSGQIEPGGSVRGWITFETPQDVSLQSIIWNPQFNESIPIGL